MGDKEIILSSDEYCEMLKLYQKYNDMTLAYRAYKETNLYISYNVFESVVRKLLKKTGKEQNCEGNITEVVDLTDDHDEDVKEEPGMMDKLLQVPIVYTTKLDDMPIFRYKKYLKYSNKRNIIYSIISHSLPKLKKIQAQPRERVNNTEKYNQLVQKIKLAFDEKKFDSNNDDLNSEVIDISEDITYHDQCKPVSVVLEDFMKSPKLQAEIRKKGVIFNNDSVDPEKLIHTPISPIIVNTSVLPVPQKISSFRDRYWLLCDKTTKEILWDLYFVSAEGNVTFLVTNQNDKQKDDILIPMSNTKSRPTVTALICCWFKRTTFLNSMKSSNVISPEAAAIMSKQHTCIKFECNCCCSPEWKKTHNQSRKDYSSNSKIAHDIISTVQSKISSNEKCLKYSYNDILQKLISSLPEKKSIINDALNCEIPTSLFLTRENIKLDNDIKINKSQVKRPPHAITPVAIHETGAKLSSSEVQSAPFVVNSQVPNSSEVRNQSETDFETQIPLNITHKHPSTIFDTMEKCKNMNLSVKGIPMLLKSPPAVLPLEPPALQKTQHTVPTISPLFQPVTFTVPHNNVIQPTIPTVFQTVSVNMPHNNVIQPTIPTPCQPVTVTVPHNNVDQPTTSNNTVGEIVQAILETFKNIRLNTDEKGKVAAVLPKPVDHLTTAELKILRHVLNLAEQQVQLLKLNPGAELSTNINFVNETDILGNINSTGNRDRSVSLSFNASVNSSTQFEPNIPGTAIQSSENNTEVPPLSYFNTEESILPEVEGEFALPKIENVFSLHEALECMKQDISENQNQSEDCQVFNSSSGGIFQDYEHFNENNVFEDSIDKEMSDIEKASNERKRKSPTSNGFPKIRLVSPSKLGIPKVESPKEYVAEPSAIMVIPPGIFQQIAMNSPAVMNTQFQHVSIVTGPAPAPPVVLNHHIDDVSSVHSQSSATNLKVDYVEIDQKGDIKKWRRGCPPRTYNKKTNKK